MEKIFAKHISDKGLISTHTHTHTHIHTHTHTHTHSSTARKKNRNWLEDLNRHFSQIHTGGQQVCEKMLNILIHQGKKIEPQ